MLSFGMKTFEFSSSENKDNFIFSSDDLSYGLLVSNGSVLLVGCLLILKHMMRISEKELQIFTDGMENGNIIITSSPSSIVPISNKNNSKKSIDHNEENENRNIEMKSLKNEEGINNNNPYQNLNLETTTTTSSSINSEKKEDSNFNEIVKPTKKKKKKKMKKRKSTQANMEI